MELEGIAKAAFLPLVLLVISLAYMRIWLPRQRAAARRGAKEKQRQPQRQQDGEDDDEEPTLRICYGTQTGTAQKFATSLQKDVFALRVSDVGYATELTDMAGYDQDNLELEQVVVFVLSTWTGGAPPESAATFCAWVEDMVQDFRVSRRWLGKLKYAVFGLGGQVYDGDYCKAARQLDARLGALGATRIAPLGLCDDQADQEATFGYWKEQLCAALVEHYVMGAAGGSVGQAGASGAGGGCGTCGSGDGDGADGDDGDDDSGGGGGGGVPDRKNRGTRNPNRDKARLPLREYRRNNREKKRLAGKTPASLIDHEDMLNAQLVMISDSDDEDDDDDESKARGAAGGGGASAKAAVAKAKAAEPELLDMEDMGTEMRRQQLEKEENIAVAREMVTPLQRRALVKEGYRILGTHSAVKLCRWTKHQLRGRGGCYKHTCYGITSYQCMETTPSLACANKCVFCWRHHKNPVGREWRWVTDPPKDILDGAMEQHVNMVRQMKGVPGVLPDRLKAADTIKHCALSLVGEPIMYPHINEFCKLLHGHSISSFLVTNAQFPEKIAELDPVTQLYVSIDAGTKESLKAVDRPLFKDFWERFLSCLDQLRAKGQRTVYRLTLVKDWNMGEVRAVLCCAGTPAAAAAAKACCEGLLLRRPAARLLLPVMTNTHRIRVVNGPA